MSVTKFWGNRLNQIGNVSLASHNSLTGGFFGRINRLNYEDVIKITDEYGETVEYGVFSTSIIDPNDISIILPIEENVREITLITCINGRDNRFIVRAREVIN